MPQQYYSGYWPGAIAKTSKYGVRLVEGEWKVCVLYDTADGVRYLAVERGAKEVAEAVNQIKEECGEGPGGAFYVNEFRHVVVPVSKFQNGDRVVAYYCAGKLEGDFLFDYHKKKVSPFARDERGHPLEPGSEWVGPRPGIPYKLAAGAKDIYFRTPALTSDPTPEIIPLAERKVLLSKILKDQQRVRRAVEPVKRVKGHAGGRFYVNETGAIFCPVAEEDGIHYIYCGQLDLGSWFPEPKAYLPVLRLDNKG